MTARAETCFDPDTGLVQTERDVSGVATSYEYDDLGRPRMKLRRAEQRQAALIA